MQLNLTNCLLALLLVLALADSCTGARSGGRFSSSRYSSYRSSSRSSSRYGSSRGTGYSTLSLMVSSRFSYRVNRLAYSRGIFFSTWAWRRSHSDFTDSSVLCFNVLDSLPAEYNSSVVEPWLYQNRTVYGLFVCPIDPDRQDRVYCCGEDESQWCCSFWEDSGRVIGLCIGLIVGIAVCIFIVYRIHRRYLMRTSISNSQSQSATADVAHVNPAMQMPSEATYTADPTTMSHGSAPTSSGTGADSVNKPHEQPFNYYGRDQQQSAPTPPPPYPAAPEPPAYWEVNNQDQVQMTPVRF